MHFVRQGRGAPALVFVHGFACSHHDWQAQIEHFGKTHEVVACDLRAHGATPVAFPIRLRWRDIPNFVELLVTRSELGYRVTGTAGIGSELGRVDLPFEHRDRVLVPRPVIRFGAGR